VVQSLVAAIGNLTASKRSMDMAAKNKPDSIPNVSIMKRWDLKMRLQAQVYICTTNITKTVDSAGRIV
jgi:hypothetical protein